jgi:tryptophan 2,3-dioxygenase
MAETIAPEGAHLDFKKAMSYGDYLKLDLLLEAQQPRSSNHNEMLFIIQHQTTELWLKLALHELNAARAAIQANTVGTALKMLARVSRIMNSMIQAWDVLATLTPTEYSAFRDSLGHSSGFQSHQYRQLEFMFGNKNAALLAPFAHREDVHQLLQAALHAPSLYDEAIMLLKRRGIVVDDAATTRDFSTPYTPNASVEAAWRAVYAAASADKGADKGAEWDLYELAEKLIDLEDYFRQWRFRHVTTVQRVIGFKRGTGGTSGVSYLKAVVDIQLFPELWSLRTTL